VNSPVTAGKQQELHICAAGNKKSALMGRFFYLVAGARNNRTPTFSIAA
jgi:hypothetical protein